MRYQFEQYVLDTECFEIHCNGASIRAEPQVIELLALLVANSSRLVTREEINEIVWRGRVVSDAALSSRVKSARQLLGDNGRDQRLIRTVHKKGFRFVAPVRVLDGTGIEPAEAASPNEAALPGVATGPPRVAAAREPEPESAPVAAARLNRPAIAVLPFSNLSAAAEQEYFSDGITADIISQLSRHRWLDVTARNTTFGYKGTGVDVRQIARDLGVSYLVEGTVQRIGARVRVTVNLVDAAGGRHLWSDRYDREVADIFALQDEITEMIVARLEPEIGFAERNRVMLKRPAMLQAWDYFHLGVYHFFRFTATDNLEAQRLLQQSAELDPGFGDAQAWWAYALVLGMVYWETPPTAELLDRALAACNRALAFDPQNATFYALRGRIKLARCEYDSALQDNQIAIGLNPSFAAAHCGLGDSLAYEGRYQEAIDRFEKAVALSPNDPQLWAFLTYGALAQLFKGDYDRALQWTEQAASLPNCQYWTIAHRVVALACLGRIEEARHTAARLLRDNPQFSIAFVREKLFYLKRPEQVQLYLEGLQRAGIH